MKNKATGLAMIATCLTCLYFGLDYYAFRSGVAKSEAEIKGVLDLANEIYDPIIDGTLLWEFPFPDEVHWRLVRRGSMVDLTGKVSSTAAFKFLKIVDQPELSSETSPTESGNFRLIVEEASIEGSVDLATGNFKMNIWPIVLRD